MAVTLFRCFWLTLAVATNIATAGLALAAPTTKCMGATWEDFRRQRAIEFNVMDERHEGKVDLREIEAEFSRLKQRGIPVGPDTARHMLAALDTNHDGVLDRAEWDAYSHKQFLRIDADHDGCVTQAELKAAHE